MFLFNLQFNQIADLSQEKGDNMASVTITHTENLSTPPEPDEYKLTTAFTDPGGEFGGDWDGYFILVEKATAIEDDVYQHICTVGDLNAYGIDRSAVAVGEYYRANTFDTFYTALSDLRDMETTQLQKTQYLVDDWTNYGTTFPAVSATTVVPS